MNETIRLESIPENIILPEGFVPLYGASISKQDLATLPAAPYRGAIHVIDSEKGLNEAVADLRSADMVGFDTETKPSFKRGQHYQVSLLQLSAGERCYLFRLNILGLPEAVKGILEDESILKIGLSIKDDFRHLENELGVEPAGFIDLQEFVKDYGIADNSLSRIYGILFGHRISKGQRLTNWEAPDLTEPQLRYAAFDALACTDIYRYLLAGKFHAEESPYYRIINLPPPVPPAPEPTPEITPSPDHKPEPKKPKTHRGPESSRKSRKRVGAKKGIVSRRKKKNSDNAK